MNSIGFSTSIWIPLDTTIMKHHNQYTTIESTMINQQKIWISIENHYYDLVKIESTSECSYLELKLEKSQNLKKI